MKVEPISVTVRELVQGYVDNAEEGARGYNSKLDIRPPYQREFVYKDKQREAVINTIMCSFPLNSIYWVVRPNENTTVPYEVLDGQQRIISSCQYVNGDFSFKDRFFHNLLPEEKEQVLSYELTVYLCSGTDAEKLEWFKVINTVGVELTNQELRNAVYAGPWTQDAKKHFSKTNCPAYMVAAKYMRGTPIRQDYLEAVLRWISNDNIEAYMASHQKDFGATELWLYFKSVMSWVETIFPKYRKEMVGVPWGLLYNEHAGAHLNPTALEAQIQHLMKDEDVTSKRGIYSYVLTSQQKHLNLRRFSQAQKRETYERQRGICPKCREYFEFDQMEADHITPWHDGGKTNTENCQLLCKEDNRKKAGK